MKKAFWISLITLFSLSAASLMVVQYVQMKRTVEVSDNLFNISVNNAMEDMIEQLNRLKVEDYISRQDRYRLLKFKRIEELNDRMQDVVKANYNLFYDTNIVQMGVTMIDSVLLQPRVKVTPEDSAAIGNYNTLLATRDKLLNGNDFYNQFVNDISEYVVDNILTANVFNYELLDSLITDKLMINGVDIHPYVGIYDYTSDNFLYCNAEGMEQKLRESPYKYRFHPNGMISPDEYFIVLQFPLSSLLLKDNSTIYYVVSLSLIFLILLLFLFTSRAIFKQEKLDEMKTDFINNMTHEIKTPIATIGLACEMLQDESVASNPENSATYIGIISDENRRMRLLIETILQNAKMSNKNFKIDFQEIELNPIVNDVVKSFKLKVDNRRGLLQCDLGADPSKIYGDELHITNLIYNLIDNAIKYSPDTLDINVVTRMENGKVVLRVSDKGLGISKDDQKHIFEKFYRVSTGDVHNVKGFGIGLNYVQQVVSMHHGSIVVDSTPGLGSTFTVSFPGL